MLVTALLISACGDTENEEQIDGEYLKSGEYQSFAEDSRLESESSKDTGVQSRLMRLPECTDVRNLTLPVTIDENELEDLLARSPDCPALETSTVTETEIKLIGRLSGNNPESWLILLEPVSVYKNRELAVATAYEGELFAYETVALFQENLSRDITTELMLEQNGEIQITAVSHRKISYPIEQENVLKVRFTIRSDGAIEKKE